MISCERERYLDLILRKNELTTSRREAQPVVDNRDTDQGQRRGIKIYATRNPDYYCAYSVRRLILPVIIAYA